MAHIGTGSSSGARRAVDHEIPLIPFIDLLLCCVMFLLATAVWSELSRLEVNASSGATEDAAPTSAPPPRLFVQLKSDRVSIAMESGPLQELPWDGDVSAALRDSLRGFRSAAPLDTSLVVAPDDDVPFDDVVALMDAAASEGFADVGLSGQLSL